MANESRKLLIRAFKAWIFQELGFAEQLSKSEDRIMASFAEYESAVNSTLAAIAQQLSEEKTLIEAAIEAANNKDQAETDAALSKLATSRAQIQQAISGLVSTEPNPTTPPSVTTTIPGTLPDVVVPVPVPKTVPTDSTSSTPATTVATVDTEIPVIVEPSPAGVGIPGGLTVSQTIT